MDIIVLIWSILWNNCIPHACKLIQKIIVTVYGGHFPQHSQQTWWQAVATYI